MRFKYAFIAFLLALASCESERVSPTIQNPNSEIEELSRIANNIRFVGELPDGQVLDFSPSSEYTNLESNNYTSVGSFNYSKSEKPFDFDVRNLSSSGGELRLLPFDFESLTINFQYTFITTYRELNELFPELDIPSQFLDYRIAYGIGSSQYDIEDLINGGVFRVSDYVFMISVPGSTTGSGFYITQPGDVLQLEADFVEFTSLKHLSSGLMAVDIGNFQPAIIGNFSLELRK